MLSSPEGIYRNLMLSFNANSKTMQLLIIYGTTEGQTRKICTYLRDKAIEQGHNVELHDATQNPPAPTGFEGIIIASSVHGGRYQSSIKHYVHEHVSELNRSRSFFMSVSLTAAGDEPESWDEIKEETREFLDSAGWKPGVVEYVAGALRYTKYDFMKRFIMRMIARKSGGDTDTTKDHEYTDWQQVDYLLERITSREEHSGQPA